MDRRTEIVEQVKKVASVYLPKQTKVFIFGSQANLKELKNADIDVGIWAADKLELKKLWEFKEALNATPNLYTFDVVDFCSVSDSFKTVALRDIEYIIHD